MKEESFFQTYNLLISFYLKFPFIYIIYKYIGEIQKKKIKGQKSKMEKGLKGSSVDRGIPFIKQELAKKVRVLS